jgi:beta-1,2-mannobiose phosphorylase / 1,2-beta-oligomannan phosphorylase
MLSLVPFIARQNSVNGVVLFELWFAKTSAGTKNRAVLGRVGLNTIIARYGMKTKTLKGTNLSSGPNRLGQFTSHHRLAAPVAPWERLKIGGGTPPVLTRHGWLIIYHGVSEMAEPNDDPHPLCYSAGLLVLSKEHPQLIRYRSAEPVLTPVLPQERSGIIANVVFPTGIDRRDDLGSPDCFDVYYGMADYRIGVARLKVPDFLPAGGVVEPPGAKV